MNEKNAKTQELIGVASVALAGVVQVSTSPGPFTIWNIIIGIPLLLILAVFSQRHTLSGVEKVSLASIWGFTLMSATGYITQGVYRYTMGLSPIFLDRLGTTLVADEWEAPGLYYLLIMIFFSLCAFYWFSSRPTSYSNSLMIQEGSRREAVSSGPVNQRIQENVAIKKIAEHLWIVEGRPTGRDEEIWSRAKRIYLDEHKYILSPVLVLILLSLVLILPYRWLSLQSPIRVDYEISWVILTLISTITLSYVGMLNGLRDRYAQSGFVKSRPKLRQIMMLMSWALFLMFICILCLLIRIVVNTYIDFESHAAGGGFIAFIAKLDYVILWSFFWSSLLRIAIFFVSYWKVLFV
jgi:hypothetical protein